MLDISPIEVLIVLVIALLIFGPKRLPEMARGLGKGIRDFKSSMSGMVDEPPPPPRERVGDPTAVPSTITAAMAAEPAAEAPVTAAATAQADDLDGVVVPGSQRPEATPTQ